MSNTQRRTHFNKKRRFFTHYWEYFSEVELNNKLEKYEWLKKHQYHGDNYYTKSCKDRKQYLKNQSYRELRRSFRDYGAKLILDLDVAEDIIGLDKPRSIKWELH